MPAPQQQGIPSPPSRTLTLNSQHRRNGPQRVFVYGTLKKGHGNHNNFLQEAKDLGQAQLEGIMFHLGGFPAINLAEKFSVIRGEVYECTWDHIVAMDQLEGVGNNFYERVEVKVDSMYLGARGIVWTYVFNRERAIERGQWVVPSGYWSGPSSPKVKWAGFGKGVEIGSFKTDSGADEIKVGPGESNYVLRRSLADSTYKLVDKNSGEVHGSFAHLRDMIGADGNVKPVLRLPSESRTTTAGGTEPIIHFQNGAPRTDGRIVSYVGPPKNDYVPVVWTPEARRQAEIKAEEENIPQAARLLGLKYGAA